jgi:threonine synthase
MRFPMKYVSTRGEAPELDFEGAMLSGLARDGGLYVPKNWPKLDLDAVVGKSFPDVAFAVAHAFAKDSIPDPDLRRMVNEAYATFTHKAVTPLKQLDHNHFLLELFHGPTIAFKDVAMQLLARMMDWSLERSGNRATIVGATSGDTGGAAIEAFKNNTHASIFILHPHGLVSDVQRRQMTTVDAPHVHNIAVEGNFDDCQAIVKALFNDLAFRDKVSLAGVNSINWARVMAQISYYVFSALALGAPHRKVSFTVPTGNFGNIFAGLAAKRMGLPIDQLVLATNINDILHRTLESGRYEVTGVHASQSPSMDIQVSSNFERLVYLATDRKPAKVRSLMANLKQSNAFALDHAALAAIRHEFKSGRTDEAETAATIRSVLAETGELIDTHTAVGVHVAKQHLGQTPMVTLATAHPAKFPDAVRKASGITPHLPPRLQHLMTAKEKFTILPNDVAAVREFMLKH